MKNRPARPASTARAPTGAKRRRTPLLDATNHCSTPPALPVVLVGALPGGTLAPLQGGASASRAAERLRLRLRLRHLRAGVWCRRTGAGALPAVSRSCLRSAKDRRARPRGASAVRARQSLASARRASARAPRMQAALMGLVPDPSPAAVRGARLTVKAPRDSRSARPLAGGPALPLPKKK